MTKILLVDDSMFQRTAIRKILEKNNFHDISEAENGEEGIKKSMAEKPDMVFLDLKMPGVNGLYVLNQIKKANPKTKVIITSIIRDKRMEDACVEEGAYCYLEKPVLEDKLMSIVESLLKQQE